MSKFITLVTLASLLDELFEMWGADPAPGYTHVQLVAWGVDRGLITKKEATALLVS